MAPEYSHKPWNRYKEFLFFLEQRNVSSVLFSYKDSRFGCLFRAAAVLIYNYDYLDEFLTKKFKKGADENQQIAQKQERKRLDMLDTLKSCGDPFTDSEEVEKFFNDKTMDNKAKQKRMKLEVQFARESTTLLLRVDTLPNSDYIAHWEEENANCF